MVSGAMTVILSCAELLTGGLSASATAKVSALAATAAVGVPLIVPLAACLLAALLFFVGLRSYSASLGRLEVWLQENV